MYEVLDLYSVNLLKQKNISYRLITLSKEPKSAEDITDLFGCKLSQVIKTLLFISDKGPILICAPSHKKIDTNKVKALLNLNDIRMAKPNEVEAITGYPVGGISPFFEYKNDLQGILDQACLDENVINIGAGTKLLGIEIAANDFKYLWHGNIEKVTK